MRRFWQWICGYVRVCVRGRQVNRFLNLCSRNGIHLWRITYDMEQSLRANLKLRDFYDIKPYLRKTKTRLKILGKKGFPFWCHRHPKLKWFFVFLLGFICVVSYSLNFVWSIEIKGNHQVSTHEILEYLEENQVDTGLKKKDINCSNIEVLLREEFHQIGWVSVYFERANLCIEVKESLYGEMKESEMESNRAYHLIANREAVIFSIVTREGKALVEKGDVVNPGDILVRGECEIFDDNGEVKEVLHFPADAEIFGDVVYEFLIPLSEIEIMSLRIGQTYDDEMLQRIAYQKLAPILEKLEQNGVIILDKNVMINKNEQNISFLATIYAREQIGINIPAEEVRENELE